MIFIPNRICRENHFGFKIKTTMDFADFERQYRTITLAGIYIQISWYFLSCFITLIQCTMHKYDIYKY